MDWILDCGLTDARRRPHPNLTRTSPSWSLWVPTICCCRGLENCQLLRIPSNLLTSIAISSPLPRISIVLHKKMVVVLLLGSVYVCVRWGPTGMSHSPCRDHSHESMLTHSHLLFGHVPEKQERVTSSSHFTRAF